MFDYTAIYAALASVAGLIVVAVVLWILAIIGEYKAFQKTGHAPFTALIPMLDNFIMGEFSGARHSAKVLLLVTTFGAFLNIIPFVGAIIYVVIVIVFDIKLMGAVSRSFGYSSGMTVLLVLLPTVAWIILGFGSAQYVGPSVQETN